MTKNSSNPPVPPPVPFWYDVRFSLPPIYRVVAILIAENKMTLTGYLDADRKWRVVGLRDGHVAWWSDCIPTPLPDPGREHERRANESRPDKKKA